MKPKLICQMVQISSNLNRPISHLSGSCSEPVIVGESQFVMRVVHCAANKQSFVTTRMPACCCLVSCGFSPPARKAPFVISQITRARTPTLLHYFFLWDEELLDNYIFRPLLPLFQNISFTAVHIFASLPSHPLTYNSVADWKQCSG
jgi:hypothetical protein